MAISDKTIKDLLIDEGGITKAELEELEHEALQKSIPLTRYLISRGRLSQQHLNELVGKFLHVPVFDLRAKPFRQEIIELLPEHIARTSKAAVFEKDLEKNLVRVAMEDPTDIDGLNYLKEYFNAEIEPYLASSEDLQFAYRLYQKKTTEGIEFSISEKIKELNSKLKKGESGILESVPLTQLFDTLMDYAGLLNASDVYFQPEEHEVRIRFRVEGMVRDVLRLDKSINDGLVTRAKTLSGLRIDEHFKPQDGRFRFHSNEIDLDIRVAVMPTFFGEKITLRLLAGAKLFLSFADLGMNQETIAKLQAAIQKPYGMILNTGPTGSGKTTTIYTILSQISTPEVHITTIEDPVEYIIPSASQTQVNLQANITFASGLRALLRHSPDIILIGETRDKETADVIINAALTGHLIVSTLHTNNAAGAIIRLIDFDIPTFLISATLNVVIGQRLVRKICVNCIESYVPPPTIAERIAREFPENKKLKIPDRLYRGKGCSICNKSGYSGRIGVFELLIVDDVMREIINTPNLTLDQIQQAARKQGMESIFEAVWREAERGITSVEEIFRVLRE